MDWLSFVVEGGALVVLVAVLFWVFRNAHETSTRLLTMIDAQLEHIKESVVVQQKVCANMDRHEERAVMRHTEMMTVLRRLNGK